MGIPLGRTETLSGKLNSINIISRKHLFTKTAVNKNFVFK